MPKVTKGQKPKIPLSLKLKPLFYCTLGHIFPRTAAKSAFKIWKKPLRFQMPARELPYAKKAEKSYMQAYGHKIRMWSWGQGPTILFIHGWGGRGTQISCWVDDMVEAGFKVVSFDMPAHGESTGTETTPFLQRDILIKIISQIDQLHTVITHSYGGLLYSSVYEQSMSPHHLVMLCPPSTFNTPLEHFKKMLKVPRRVQQRIIQNMLKEAGENTFQELSTIENVKKMNHTILVIHDKNDTVVPFDDGIEVAKSAKNGFFVGTHEFGHVHLLYEDYILNIIKDFISN